MYFRLAHFYYLLRLSLDLEIHHLAIKLKTLLLVSLFNLKWLWHHLWFLLVLGNWNFWQSLLYYHNHHEAVRSFCLIGFINFFPPQFYYWLLRYLSKGKRAKLHRMQYWSWSSAIRSLPPFSNSNRSFFKATNERTLSDAQVPYILPHFY